MVFGINAMYFWLFVIIVGVIAEIVTLDLCAIWFAIGGVFALIAASLNLNVTTQMVIFVLFSAVLLVLVRPFCRKFVQVKKEPTNADRIVMQTGVVTSEINNLQENGEIKVMGQVWTARSIDDTVIPEKSTVQIVCIQGVKAIVKQLEDEKGEE